MDALVTAANSTADKNMAKAGATRGRRQSKRLTPGVVDESENNSTDQAKSDSTDVKTEVEDKVPAETQDVKAEIEDVKEAEDDCVEVVEVKAEEQKGPQSGDVEEAPAENATTEDKANVEEEPKTEEGEETEEAEVVIEVKGSAPTVSVSWEKKEEQEDDQEKTEEAEMSHEVEKASEPQAEVPVEEPEENPTVEEREETEEQAEDKEDEEMETAETEENECVPMTTGEDGQSDEEGKEEKDKENGKRKAESTLECSPSKKTKLINEGYCIYVGNLNNSKWYEEIKTALANFFMTQSILVQDIRLDKAKKHAFVDMASEMDLTKALSLNGETLLDKPMKIFRAKVKTDDEPKVKTPEDRRKAKDERSLFVKNIPYSATREDLLKVFSKATRVRFLGGTDSPSKGVAIMEFPNKDLANAARTQSKKIKIQGRLLILDVVGVHSKNDTNNNNNRQSTEANETLFVSNLPYSVKENQLKKIFKQAVNISIPQNDGKAKGYAFVEFASVSEAEKALQSSKSSQIHKRPLRVQFCVKSKTEEPKVLCKTLIVLGLDENTTAETLKEAFDGALKARINVDKDTGASRKFGFVDFGSAESCKLAKESMEDCQIDGCKVTVDFARPKRLERESGGPGRGRGHNFRGRGNRGGRGRGTGQPIIKKEVKQEN